MKRFINNNQNIPKNFYDEKYGIHNPPHGLDFHHMTKKQALDTFDWCMEKTQKMIEWITDCCVDALGISPDRIDYSLESLIFIWRWFLKVVSLEIIPQERIEIMKKARIMLGEEDPMPPLENIVQFTYESNLIMLDIGMYIAQCYKLMCPKLEWDCVLKPKSDIIYGQPVLQGFWEHYEGFLTGKVYSGNVFYAPYHMVGVQAAKCIFGTQQDTDMYRSCKIWEEKLPKD